MPVNARGIPRFLPTLTEVVHSPADLQPVAAPVVVPDGQPAAALPAAPVEVPSAVTHSAEALLQDMGFQAQLESRVRQVVASALSAQIDRVTGQLMGELEPAVRQLVRENLLREGRPHDPS